MEGMAKVRTHLGAGALGVALAEADAIPPPACADRYEAAALRRVVSLRRPSVAGGNKSLFSCRQFARRGDRRRSHHHRPLAPSAGFRRRAFAGVTRAPREGD